MVLPKPFSNRPSRPDRAQVIRTVVSILRTGKTYPALTDAIGVTSRQNWGELSFRHLESAPAQRPIPNNPKKLK